MPLPPLPSHPSAGIPEPASGPGADSAEFELLELLELRFELAVDAAAIGGFDWNLVTNELTWDDRMKVLMGGKAASQLSVGSFVNRIIPADRPVMQAAAQHAIETCGDLRSDFRVIDDAGATRWLTTRGKVICNGAGKGVRMIGAVYDSSSVHTDREQAARALDTMATAYATVDRQWEVRYANHAARKLLAGRGEPVGRLVWELVPGLANPTIERALRDVMAGAAPATVELRADQLGAWVEVSVQPVANGIAVLINDVTARREAQNEAAAAASRLELLAQAGTALVQRHPVPETVEVGLSLLVPRLAEGAMIYLRQGPDRRLRLIGLRHEDAVTQADLHQLYEHLPLGDDPATATGQAVLTGRTQLIGDLDETFINRATADPELRRRLLGHQSRGVLAVPLVSRGEAIGFIGLLGLGGQTPSGADRVLIEDIASRVASAIDNAQIFGQVQQARQTAELVSARLEFLAEVADAMGSTLDAEQAALRLARMVVPALADWSMVSLLDDSGRVADIASHHCDPARQDLLDRYTQLRWDSVRADPSVLLQITTPGRPLFQLDGATFSASLAGDPSAQTLIELQPGFVTALPILARDRTLGVISLYSSAGRGRPTDLELDAAREVARRAGLVLDNARLYARSRSMAETLQRSLLTEVAEPSVATRYVPAIADAQVGGDWFDAFQTPDGTPTLVIGDVMGHDTEAAALMGQLRTLVRAIAVDRQESPSSVLSRVDAAARTLGIDTTATAVLAQVLVPPGGGPRQLRWSNAGHPPPVLLLPGGTASVLESEPDLLLGLGAGFPRKDHLADLPLGSTVLMFTDGLVEGRSQPLEAGLRKLTNAAGPLAGLALEDLCDQLLEALLPPHGAEDDVALVAIRVEQVPDPQGPP